MNERAAASLFDRLHDDPHADLTSLKRDTDRTLSIGSDVWRLRWRSQLATAVAGDADLHTTCGALLDVLALRDSILEAGRLEPGSPELDLTEVNVLVDRPMPGGMGTETDQALRSMRDATVGVAARIWYARAESGWIEDQSPAPTWEADDPRLVEWRTKYLRPRLHSKPSGLVLDLVKAVNDPSLHLYPSEIRSGVTDRWALRLDGLQVGIARPDRITLEIGKAGPSGDGPQRRAFIEVFGQASVVVSSDHASADGSISVTTAAARIHELMRVFRSVDVPGAPICHRTSGGRRIVDEHALEARLLKGLVRIQDGAPALLVVDDESVARGSQFPTLWGHGAKPRYLDAMLRRDTTPLALELKVATGGQGRYYRRSLVQAVLYRHFITNAPAVDGWFAEAGLVRLEAKAGIGVPIPHRWTKRFEVDLSLLRAVAEKVGVTVHVLDDRAAPDFHAGDDWNGDTELLSWRLAAELSRRWPRSLGLFLESHGGGGQYDQLELRAVGDRAVVPPHSQAYVSLNRVGSASVFSPFGTARWTWRGIWGHLAAGGSAGAAAEVLGAMAGLDPPEPASGSTFADLAVALLEGVGTPGWSWRCAWSDEEATWAAPFEAQLRRYQRDSPGGSLPATTRIWGAVLADEAKLIVDQQNLRVWVNDNGRMVEATDPDPMDRMASAIKVIAG